MYKAHKKMHVEEIQTITRSELKGFQESENSVEFNADGTVTVTIRNTSRSFTARIID